MKFAFTGEGEITIREVTFPSGKAVEVENEDLAAKLARLEYFREVKSRRRGAPVVDQPAEEAPDDDENGA